MTVDDSPNNVSVGYSEIPTGIIERYVVELLDIACLTLDVVEP